MKWEFSLSRVCVKYQRTTMENIFTGFLICLFVLSASGMLISVFLIWFLYHFWNFRWYVCVAMIAQIKHIVGLSKTNESRILRWTMQVLKLFYLPFAESYLYFEILALFWCFKLLPSFHRPWIQDCPWFFNDIIIFRSSNIVL